MITELHQSIDTVNCHAAVLAEIDWIVSSNTVVRPDVSVVCGDAPAGHIQQPPALVAEIHSGTTRDRDLGVKRDMGVKKDWYE